MLITLKDFARISHLSAIMGYSSCRTSIGLIIGKIGDLAEITDAQAKSIIIDLERQVAEKKEAASRVIVMPEEITVRQRGKSKKKEIEVIE